MAITISIPRVVLVFVDTSTVWGLANAAISKANANKRKMNSTCLNFGNQELVTLNPFKLDILNSAVCFLFLKMYHSKANGNANSNQKNSLFKNQQGAKQDKISSFANKIRKICKKRNSDDFMVIARIESFILGKGLNDALKRAIAYSKAGADAILIHSKKNTPKEIFNFAKKFSKNKFFKPLVAVPSTYSKVYEKDLIKNNFKIVIYANQLLRAAYPAMTNVAKTILTNQRAFEADKNIISIKEIINLVKND